MSETSSKPSGGDAPGSHADTLRRMDALLEIMARLRNPDGGCPWDLEQSFKTIAPYTIEEAYEVADAIHKGDMKELKEELGDLLLQVVFHARMAEEEEAFDFADVVEAVSRKMIRRHPHVFGEKEIATAEEQTRHWEDLKAAERAEKGADDSVLDGLPAALPALMKAVKLQKRASRVGFDWGAALPVLDKVEEELGELREAIAAEQGLERIMDEFGDILFAYANLARHLDIDPEQALAGTNAKFERRFREIERRLKAQGRSAAEASLDEMEALWTRIKSEEKP